MDGQGRPKTPGSRFVASALPVFVPDGGSNRVVALSSRQERPQGGIGNGITIFSRLILSV
jgi:hypothetical protein